MQRHETDPGEGPADPDPRVDVLLIGGPADGFTVKVSTRTTRLEMPYAERASGGQTFGRVVYRLEPAAAGGLQHGDARWVGVLDDPEPAAAGPTAPAPPMTLDGAGEWRERAAGQG